MSRWQVKHESASASRLQKHESRLQNRDGKMTIFFGPARPVVPLPGPARPVIQFLILGPFGPVWGPVKIC